MSIAVIGLTYDAIDVQDWPSGIFIEIVSGIAETPVVRGDDSVIPAAAGTLEGNRVVDHLPIELRVKNRASDATDGDPQDDQRASHFANLLTIRTLFSPSRARAPLAATLPGGTIMTIQARPLNIVSAEPVPGEFTELSISLEGDGDWEVL